VKKFFRTTVFACLIAFAIALLAFGPRGQYEAPPGFVHISYWDKWSGQAAWAMQGAVDDFNNTVGKEKHIVVEYISMPEVNKKTLISTAGGVPPEIAGLWDMQVAQFAALGALEPLDQLAAEHGIDRSKYKNHILEMCSYRGGLYAIPNAPASVALVYNKLIFLKNGDKLRAAGLDPLKPPQTIDELDRYNDVLTERDDRGRIVRAGYVPIDSWYVNMLNCWFDSELWDSQTGKFLLTSDKNVRAFEWLQGYAKKWGPGSVTEFRAAFGSYSSTQNPFLNRKVAMVQQGSWHATNAWRFNPDMNQVLMPASLEFFVPRVVRPYNYEWAAAAFPSVNPSIHDAAHVEADVFAIPRGAKHKREAFEFLAYLQRQDVMEKFCLAGTAPSPLRNVSDDFLRNHPNPYIDVWEMLQTSPHAQTVPPIPIFAEFNSELQVMVQRMYLLQAEAKDALATTQQRMEEKYTRYLEENPVDEEIPHE
jgi:multiple sugar transport system substrate-binding protein